MSLHRHKVLPILLLSGPLGSLLQCSIKRSQLLLPILARRSPTTLTLHCLKDGRLTPTIINEDQLVAPKTTATTVTTTSRTSSSLRTLTESTTRKGMTGAINNSSNPQLIKATNNNLLIKVTPIINVISSIIRRIVSGASPSNTEPATSRISLPITTRSWPTLINYELNEPKKKQQEQPGNKPMSPLQCLPLLTRPTTPAGIISANLQHPLRKDRRRPPKTLLDMLSASPKTLTSP